MPKICSHSFNSHNAGKTRYYNLEVHYHEGLFYVEIPAEFSEVTESLTEEDKGKYFVSTIYIKRGRNKTAVTGATEESVKLRMHYFLNAADNMRKLTRDVIIVYFDSDDRHHGSSPSTNQEHKQINMEMGLLYCKEITIGEGEAIYSNQYGHRHQLGYRFKENHKGVILDDTEENRAFLENTYTAYKNLIDKLSTFFTNKDVLIQLIESKQKLLG